MESRSTDAWRSPSVVVATCLWLGRIPFAPGTWGAAAGVLLSLATGFVADRVVGSLAGFREGFGLSAIAVEAAILAAMNLAAIPICTAAARRLGRGSDPGAIVLDEALTVPLGLLVVPFSERSWPVLAVAWALHRVFDITKPFPCRWLERLPAGLGVMADDQAAAAWMAASLLLWRSLA